MRTLIGVLALIGLAWACGVGYWLGVWMRAAGSQP